MVSGQTMMKNDRSRARDLGLRIGVLPTGTLNAITDVAGVRVGHTTLIRGDNLRTGVTAILPHGGNLFREKVPGAVFIGNAFGKLAGSTQVNELGEIETPILLTSTLNVPRVADAVIDYMLALDGNTDVQSINPLVGETNDGGLNDIRSRPVTKEDVLNAINNAKAGEVEEGAVGAGTGTIAFGFKGGIGTSSRKLSASLGGFTVGVLVQSNFGGILTINGAPVGRELGKYYLKDEIEKRESEKKTTQNQPSSTQSQIASNQPDKNSNAQNQSTVQSEQSFEQNPDGSIIIVIATDAPLDERNLRRLAARSMMGLARAGSSASNGSGDYAIAFSTATEVRIRPGANALRELKVLSNNAMSPLFEAVIEATEEAIYNSLFRAVTMEGRGRKIEALPIDKTVEILRKYNALSDAKKR
ncbi:MAG: P1 family peptidase [Acidobacteriota bacterium]